MIYYGGWYTNLQPFPNNLMRRDDTTGPIEMTTADICIGGNRTFSVQNKLSHCNRIHSVPAGISRLSGNFRSITESSGVLVQVLLR